ncbi:polysaccharide biosynthesis/export family protein [Sphingobacterium bambusae]|uniref:Polysaccharide biosynthesis/export family protein n=1 Tax=Sphingobacterium bambusae TaxID=662858 RepID=A0ABW6BFH2_9SPHI|nr:polysaccharide biosynthesis/export family protein [Sphingobacterium bambusae]WPL46876.1 polysaccharide biosynthesis/export family protein [Sphingobacterium bambusae]
MKDMNPKPPQVRITWLALLALFFMASCASVKNTVYFNDLPIDSVRVVKEAAAFTEPVIQADDILSITIQTIDPTTSAVANQSVALQAVGASTASNVGNQVISGFLVDKDGFINMALIGKVEVKGLTTYQARERITTLAAQYYKNPAVQVRFANYKITVLGEVMRPATYTVPNEKVSVLDALGLAGDLTIYGRRENVLLVREQNGVKELVRLNLNDSQIFQSPYFYLKQNDVLYIEPGKAKAAANNAARTQTFAIIGSIVSVLIIALTRIR